MAASDESEGRPATSPKESASPGRTAGRLVAIDVLRALAVLLVIGRHLAPAGLDVSRVEGGLGVFLRGWHRGGWIGVDIFFVLSGFLVSGLLFREFQRYGKLRIGRFLIRRGFKIYPAFYLFIALTVLFFRQMGVSWDPMLLVREIFFVQNYGLGLWGHTWSLAVEEHFYFLLAFVLMVTVRLRRGGNPFTGLPRLFFAVAAVALILRGLTFYLSPPPVPPPGALLVLDDHLYPTHLRLDGLFFGVLLSYLFHFYHDLFMGFVKRWRAALVVVGTVLLVPPFVFEVAETPFLYTGGLSLLYLGSGMILCGTLEAGFDRVALLRVIAWIGPYTYSIYLWHMAVGMLLRSFITFLGAEEFSPAEQVIWNVTLSIGVGIGMALVVELPLLAVRDRFFPSRSAAMKADPSAGLVEPEGSR